ncbi:MAG: hypothetical protein KAH32_07570 [Chlamydiia bacterium]|nr:hypothetical protein [Chlamydiia bacterium]
MIVGLSSIVGYITGITIQPLFSQIFKNFWTIPLDTVHFSFISLVLTAIVPAILIGLLVLIIVMTIMRGRVVDNLSDKESRLGQAFSSTVMKLIG